MFRYTVHSCQVYSCCYKTDLQNFSSCKFETLYSLNNFPLPLVTTFLLSVSMSLTTLDTSYERDHTVFVFL